MMKDIKESMYIDWVVIKEYIGTVIKKDKAYVFLMFLFSIFGGGVTTIDTLLIKYVVDQLTHSESVEKVILTIVCGISATAILSICNCWIKQKIEYKNLDLINLCVIGKALMLSPPFPPPHTVRESFLLIRRSNELLHLLNW